MSLFFLEMLSESHLPLFQIYPIFEMCSFCMSAVTQAVSLLFFSLDQFPMYCTSPC